MCLEKNSKGGCNTMRKKNSFCRGAVSIFLVIVLVPSIVCASLFVDASRVKSARGLVSSAGELTLNTVLSQYDVDLNDFYGLMASAQDTDDVLSAAEDYFNACIKSQGINTTDTAKWANSIKNIFLEDEDVSDLLGLNLAPDTNVTVEKTKDGSLKNPGLVKTQVVEFMKYRSPINCVTDLFNKFKSSSKELENSAKTSDLVDKKQDYYEAQGEVAKKAYEIYQNIVKYDKLGIDSTDLNEMKSFINSLKGKYDGCHIKMVKDLYNTQGISKEFHSCSPIPSQYSHQSKYNNASAETIGGLINGLMRSYDQFMSAKDSFDENVKAYSDSYYDIQYWAYCCKNYSYFNNVYEKRNNLTNSYINLIDAVEHASGDTLNKEYVSTYNSSHISGVVKGTVKSIQSWWDTLKTMSLDAVKSVSGQGTKYNTAVEKLKILNLNDRISTSDTDKTLTDTYNTLNGYYTRYCEAFTLLSDIVKGLGQLKNLISDADEKFDTWEDKADEYYSDIELAKSDKEEINEVKQKEKDNKKLKESDVQEYINHINNVKSAVGTVKEGIPKIKYGGHSIVSAKSGSPFSTNSNDINGYAKFRNFSNVDGNDIPLNKYDLEDYAKNTCAFSMDGVGISSLNFTESNNPKIRDKKYAVYDWMIRQGFSEPLDKDKEKKYNEKKDAADDKIKNAEDLSLTDVSSENDIFGLENLPSGTFSDVDAGKITTKIKDVSSFVGKLFGDFGSTVSQAGVDTRDDLYVLDYITSMLTWQTFEYEAKYNMLDKSQQKNITCSNAASYYNDKKDAWVDIDVTKKYNKTLTNKLRNSEKTNWSYCNEVEYIMYGQKNSDSKSALNGSIYMIRFALNIPAVFSTYYKDKVLTSFAQSVNLATHGIVPAGLVKVIICLGLTAVESAKDLKTLRSGIPVILIKKNDKDLFLDNWETFTPGDNPKVTDKTEAVTFFYSDYMKLILFIKLLGSESTNIYGRLADVIQTNMSKCVIKGEKEYLLEKSQVYYTIDATLKVKPLMLNTSYVRSYMDSAPGKMENWNTIKYSATRGY